MNYLKDAKHYYDLAPYDWIHRVLTAMKKRGEDYSVKIKEDQKEASLAKIPLREMYAVYRTHTLS